MIGVWEVLEFPNISNIALTVAVLVAVVAVAVVVVAVVALALPVAAAVALTALAVALTVAAHTEHFFFLHRVVDSHFHVVHYHQPLYLLSLVSLVVIVH